MNKNDPFIPTNKVANQKADYKIFNIKDYIEEHGEQFNTHNIEKYLNRVHNEQGYKLI